MRRRLAYTGTAENDDDTNDNGLHASGYATSSQAVHENAIARHRTTVI
jgi:hypothetical protein